MPNINVDLYDDREESIVTTIHVVCSEPEGKYLEMLAERVRWHARRLPSMWGHNVTFRQFQTQFLEPHRATGTGFVIHK